ncbi:MAG: NAD(P)-dependent alcohol dehydrogenase [Dehalococcoidia bacterium]|nr:MAG: NAD(P)-dependent alcohol dehydrogenase [Dehalococcoidia bacterium]
MKAIVHDRYGPPDNVLNLKDVDKPVPTDDEVLVRVHAASTNGGDPAVVGGRPYVIRIMGFGLFKPKNKILGDDIAGRVEAVGKNVEQFQPDDEVFGFCSGAFAEYVCTSQDWLAPKPANITFEQAAAVPSSAVATLQGLRDQGQLQPGQKVLINGASGGVGTFAVQIAKSLGAEVTGVCSAKNADTARSIGADHIVDYAREDFASTDERHDLMLDVAANRTLADCRRALTSRGTYVLIGGGHGRWVGGLPRFFTTRALSPFVSERMRAFFATRSREDLVYVKTLIEGGEVTPIIDRTYPLSQTSQAISYVEEGHARGKVVITAADPG